MSVQMLIFMLFSPCIFSQSDELCFCILQTEVFFICKYLLKENLCYFNIVFISLYLSTIIQKSKDLNSFS